jgi:hypothetical protein
MYFKQGGVLAYLMLEYLLIQSFGGAMMKTKNNNSKVYRFARLILSVSAVFLLSTVSAFAAKTVTYDGIIQGAGCLHYHAVCPTSDKDPAVAIERDFVLQANGKTIYYMPNIDRSVKFLYTGKRVRVTGNPSKNEIYVTRLQVKGKHGYQTVWSLAQQQKMYQTSGGGE